MRYDIRVRGRFDRALVTALGDITITAAERDTILHCQVPDVAALVGILHAVTAHGLTVKEVRTADVESP
ncbi:hypothetical protein [Occultella gossypii]|uniref:Uncharacterized protein n=1 Tax=Occultella gossypii TaxID=2800820 RepID=A0ABS7S8A2_9MICO|nr:hypothetical protein [Occultella gossypii]MBZ2195849.1 hypothetical protein [Occultella gossypii]